jgi:anti-sigma regulatory factor (Ser/Thr protein kinase)
MSADFAVTLPGDLDAGRVARRAFEAQYPSLSQSLRDDLALLVTELVANAVVHGGGRNQPLQLEFGRRNGSIHVAVVDPGTDFEAPPRPTHGDSSGGWGLFLVDRIAQRWGVSPGPSGTRVWFELSAGVAY